VPLPGFTHGVREPDMTVRLYSRIMAFFDEHLRGAARRGTP
jgi:dipeptidyl aminopeptidase/acylaminoacyl peptidase